MILEAGLYPRWAWNEPAYRQLLDRWRDVPPGTRVRYRDEWRAWMPADSNSPPDGEYVTAGWVFPDEQLRTYLVPLEGIACAARARNLSRMS